MATIKSLVESSMARVGLTRLDEISDETKKRYAGKALKDLSVIGKLAGGARMHAHATRDREDARREHEYADRLDHKAKQRVKGISSALGLEEDAVTEAKDYKEARKLTDEAYDRKVHFQNTHDVKDPKNKEEHEKLRKDLKLAKKEERAHAENEKGQLLAKDLLKESPTEKLPPIETLLLSRGLIPAKEASKLAVESDFLGKDKSTGESHFKHPKHGHISLLAHPSGSYQFRSESDLKEDILNELSPSTLGSYIKSADIDRAAHSGLAGAERAIASMAGKDGRPDEHYMAKSNKAQSRSEKRFHGILRATDKLVGKAHRPADLRESVRAHGIPQYLYNLGKELGSDLGFHKESRMINPKTNSKDYVFHVDRLSDAAKERIKKDYPEAVLGLSSGSQFAPEHQNPIIVIPGKSRRKDIIYGDSMTEAESLNELSPSTLGDYIKHATIDNGAAHGVAGAERAIARMSGTVDHPDEHYMDQAEKETARANKRFRGILRATNKLVAKTHSVKEVEESLEGDTLNELSKETLGRYITKAAKDISLRSYLAGNHEPGREKIEVTLKHIDKSHKHTKGIEKAVKKLTEAAPPDMEDWVKANKAKFVKQYGDKKGHEILYATAWKMHNNKIDEETLTEAAIGHVVKLKNGKHFQISGFKMGEGTKLTNVPGVGIAPEPGSKVTHYIGTLGNSRVEAERNSQRVEVPLEDVIKEDLLNELSKNTLHSYLDKAESDLDNSREEREESLSRAHKLAASGRSDSADEHFRVARSSAERAAKREHGVSMAKDKLGLKEQSLNELSKDTLWNYIDKAETDANDRYFDASALRREGMFKFNRIERRNLKDEAKRQREKADKRIAGVTLAADKVTRDD